MSDRVINYYEALVFEELERQLNDKSLEVDEDAFSDMCCIALNQLPARYVRHAIDTTFYSTPEELQKMEDNVKNAIEHAIGFILK